MNEAAIGKSNVDERTEVDNVEHRPAQFHPSLQVFELDNILAKDRRRQILTRIAAGPAERFDHVVERECANAKLCGKNRTIERGDKLLNPRRVTAANNRSRLDA